MNWFEETPQGILLRIKAQPRAAKSQIVGLHGDPPRLKIRISAPPVDGKANAELLRFLSEALALPLSKLKVVRGETAPKKDVLCMGVPVAKIMGLLAPGGPGAMP